MKAAKIFWAKLKTQAVSYQMVITVKVFQPFLLTQSQWNLFLFVIIKIVIIHSNISPFQIGVNPPANSSEDDCRYQDDWRQSYWYRQEMDAPRRNAQKLRGGSPDFSIAEQEKMALDIRRYK